MQSFVRPLWGTEAVLKLKTGRTRDWRKDETPCHPRQDQRANTPKKIPAQNWTLFTRSAMIAAGSF